MSIIRGALVFKKKKNSSGSFCRIVYSYTYKCVRDNNIIAKSAREHPVQLARHFINIDEVNY